MKRSNWRIKEKFKKNQKEICKFLKFNIQILKAKLIIMMIIFIKNLRNMKKLFHFYKSK